ncbi:MAG: hypothetical protein KDC26_04495 [Armatimonadetes bacterium]|nr:hypothetical protein [Armatimonadota bacterium]
MLKTFREEPTWNLRLFSGYRLCSPGGDDVHSRSKDLELLLSLLAFSRDHVQSREQIATAIYGEPGSTTERRLAVLLSRTKKKLVKHGNCFIRFNPDHVWLDLNLIKVDLARIFDCIDDICENSDDFCRTNELIDEIGELSGTINASNATTGVARTIEGFQERLARRIREKLTPSLGPGYSTSLCALLDTLNIPCELPSIVCHLLEIYGELGESTMAHHVLCAHEDYLESEFGEAVSKKVLETYESTIKKSAADEVIACKAYEPQKKNFSIGFNTAISNITDQIVTGGKNQSICVYGPSGSGKSHFLSDLYHGLKPLCTVLCVDLATGLSGKTAMLGSISDTDVLLVDNFCADNLADFRALLQISQPKHLIFTSYKKDELFNAVNTPIPLLSIGNRLNEGPAVKLFEHYFGTNFDDLPTLSKRKIVEIIDYCNQTPSSIKATAIKCREVGLDIALNSIKLQPGSWNHNQSDQHFEDLLDQNLTAQQVKVCQCILRSSNKLIPTMIDSLPEIPSESVIELVQLRVLKSTESGIVSVNPSYRMYFENDFRFQVDPTVWQIHFRDLAHWASRLSISANKDPLIYEHLDVFWSPIEWLLDDDDRLLAVRLFSDISTWFGSMPVPDRLTSRFQLILHKTEIKSHADWGQLALAVGRALFASGKYNEMGSLYDFVQSSDRFKHLPTEVLCSLSVIGSIAHTWLNEFEIAETILLGIKDKVQRKDLLLRIYFNLGCVAERADNLEEALKYYELAFTHYDESHDPRLMAFNSIGALRNRYKLHGQSETTLKSCKSLLTDARLLKGNEIRSMILGDIGIIQIEANQSLEAIGYLSMSLLYLFSVSTTGEVTGRSRLYIIGLIEALDSVKDTAYRDLLSTIKDCFDLLLSSKQDEAYKDLEYLRKLIAEVSLQLLKSYPESEIVSSESFKYLQNDCPLLNHSSLLDSPLEVCVDMFKGHCRKYADVSESIANEIRS